MDKQTNNPKVLYPCNFFEVEGIKTDGVDAQADLGTHCAHASQIKMMMVITWDFTSLLISLESY